MVVHLQSPFALIVGGVPHAYQGVSDDDGMHHYRFYLSPDDMGMFMSSLQHTYAEYADVCAELSQIALSVFWWFRYYGRYNLETLRVDGLTVTRLINAPDGCALRAFRRSRVYVYDLYVYQDMRWVHHKQFPIWKDALRHAARLK